MLRVAHAYLKAAATKRRKLRASGVACTGCREVLPLPETYGDPLGKFIYGTPSTSVEFDDRVLAHLKVVIIAKLRRGESFTFSWERSPSSGSGHSSIWLHPAIPLEFNFQGNKDAALNRA